MSMSSSSSSSSSSHVLDIRRRTAQERLRGDHIELLFQLEALEKENNDLMEYIKQLEKQLSTQQKQQQQQPQQQQKENENPAEEKEKKEENYELLIKKLQKDFQSLEIEYKTVKTTMTLNTKMKEKYEGVIHSLEQSLIKKEEEKNRQIMFYEEIQTRKENEILNSLKIIQEQAINIQDLNRKINSEMESKESQKENEQKYQILEGQHVTLQQKFLTLESSYRELENRYEQASSQLLHAQSLSESLLQQNKHENPLPVPLRCCLTTDNSCQTDNEITPRLYCDEGYDIDIRSITPDTTTVGTGLPPELMSSYSINEDEMSIPREKNSPNFNFQEYIRLKRENLSLRVLLANTTNMNSNQHQRMNSTRTSTSSSSSNHSSTQHSYQHPPTSTSSVSSSSSSNTRHRSNQSKFMMTTPTNSQQHNNYNKKMTLR